MPSCGSNPKGQMETVRSLSESRRMPCPVKTNKRSTCSSGFFISFTVPRVFYANDRYGGTFAHRDIAEKIR